VTEQLTPCCGENEFYNKYNVDIEKVNDINYNWFMEELLTIYLILVCLLVWGMTLCTFFLGYFPKSKLSDFIRRHIITDEDIEPYD
jgi:hypothetical protein